MNGFAVKVLFLLSCLGLAGCERNPSGNEEVASELRALRLALRDSRPQANAESPLAAREAIDAAMRPLRDVLTQLGNAQRELATRQSALTQELQHWTQLVVGAMQDKQAQQGRDLQLRLEQLEQTMAQQDARHREVEALMQGALDNTATHLEDFLRRLEQLAPRRDDQLTPRSDDAPTPVEPTGGAATGAGGSGEAGSSPAAEQGSAPPTNAGSSRGTAGAPPAARQGSSRWPWWVLAVAAVVMGVRLMLPRRRPALAIAPEMQTTARAGGEALHARPAATADTALDEPEVEELWAAAALLGEAIGKIKQSAHPEEVERLLTGPLGEVATERAEPAAASNPVDRHEVEPELDFDDLFVIDDEIEEAQEDAAVAAAVQPTTGPLQGEFAVPVGAEPPLPQHTGERLFELPRAVAPTRNAEGVPSRPESITCRLAVRDAPRAVAAILELLGTDPRVLVQPAPEVRPAAGELCVQFALLPGLPAGERSQLEQRLRDAVA